MNGVRVNTQLIAERRRELNMSERTLIKLTGVTVRLVYSPNETDAESYSHGASMTLAELSRLASALAVSPTELLMTERPAPAGAPADDVAVLMAALMDGARVTLTRKDDLASALNWPLERVERAASQAAEHLPALGLTLHHSPADGVGLRPRHGILAPAEQRNLARAKTRVPQLMRSEVVRKVVVSRYFDMPNRCSACI